MCLIIVLFNPILSALFQELVTQGRSICPLLISKLLKQRSYETFTKGGELYGVLI